MKIINSQPKEDRVTPLEMAHGRTYHRRTINGDVVILRCSTGWFSFKTNNLLYRLDNFSETGQGRAWRLVDAELHIK